MAKFTLKKEFTDLYEPVYRIYRDGQYIQAVFTERENEALDKMNDLIEKHKLTQLSPQIIREIEI
jgi:hypothetical protein